MRRYTPMNAKWQPDTSQTVDLGTVCLSTIAVSKNKKNCKSNYLCIQMHTIRIHDDMIIGLSNINFKRVSSNSKF